jgi:YfiH family protein
MSLRSQLTAVQWARNVAACTRFPRPFGVTGKAGVPPPCHRLQQVHGTQLLLAPFSVENPTPKGDGIFLWETSGTVAVVTADCVPVLLTSALHPFVLAVHAGWRGLSQGILPQAIEMAARYGIPAEALYAVVGPAIGAGKFEVGPEVLEAFSQANAPGLESSQLKGVEDRWHLDLQQLAVFSLLDAGMIAEQLSVVRSCTYMDSLQWHSYRRDGGAAERNWSWVSLLI